MNSLLLSLYILVWPAISAILLVLLTIAVARDYRAARRTGQDVV